MVDQTQVNGPPVGETAPRAVARSTGELLEDLVTLGELQARRQLYAADAARRLILFPAAADDVAADDELDRQDRGVSHGPQCVACAST